MTIRSFRTRVLGQIVLIAKDLIVKDINSLVEGLLDDSFAKWAAANWHRFDCEEINCTMQLYRWAKEVCRETPKLGVLEVSLEYSLPTPEMLQGTESAKTMTRPDLRVHVGDAGISIECKRLGMNTGQSRMYVDEGIDRFVSGNYAGRHDVGFMVGYGQVSASAMFEPATVVKAVNWRITSHPAMGSGHCLSPLVSRAQYAARYQSDHQRPNAGLVLLEHFWVSLP